MNGVTLEGFESVSRQFKGIQKKMESLPEDFKHEGGSILLTESEQTFATENQGQWPDLAESTIARKRKKYSSKGTLERTGAGRRSIKVRFGRNFIERYTSKYYMRFHELGNGVPQRKFMDVFSDTAMELLKDAYERSVLK